MELSDEKNYGLKSGLHHFIKKNLDKKHKSKAVVGNISKNVTRMRGEYGWLAPTYS